MGFGELKGKVLEEVGEALEKVDTEEIDRFVQALAGAGQVFVMGAGRSMMMAQAFAKRLAHLGLKASVVGAATAPPMTAQDLLVACSASGETRQTVAIAEAARDLGGKVAVVTASSTSTLLGLADISLRIPAPVRGGGSTRPGSVQPMNNTFEQALLLFLDCTAILLQQKLGISPEMLKKAHANLE